MNPVRLLVSPRVIVTSLMLPFLVILFTGISLTCTYVTGVLFFHVDAGVFFDKIPWLTDPIDVLRGLFKAAVFGFILSVIGCYKGYYALPTTKGVGRATASAVVTSLILILITDYVISYFQNELI